MNVDNTKDITYENGKVVLRQKGSQAVFMFPFNKEICKILAQELDVTKWDYLSYDDFSCKANILIPKATGFSSYWGGVSGNWGRVNCYQDGGDYKDGSNASLSTRMQDCNDLTGNTIFFMIAS